VRTHSLRDAIGLAVEHGGLDGGVEESAWHFLHFFDDVGHLQQVTLGVIQRHLSAAETRDVRRVSCLKGGHHLRQPLAGADLDVFELIFLDAGLLGIGITLFLGQLVHLRRQRDRPPHDQFLPPLRVSPAHQPPGSRRHQHPSRPNLS
jgi:hypothetical protein